MNSRLISIETPLNDLLGPLRDINAALDQEVCVPVTGPCLSVNDVFQAIEDARDFLGLSVLEDLANALLDPMIATILAPLEAAFPSVPEFPGLDLQFPDYSTLLDDIDRWDGTLGALRDLLDMPAIFECAEADDVIESARTTDAEWRAVNNFDGGASGGSTGGGASGGSAGGATGGSTGGGSAGRRRWRRGVARGAGAADSECLAERTRSLAEKNGAIILPFPLPAPHTGPLVVANRRYAAHDSSARSLLALGPPDARRKSRRGSCARRFPRSDVASPTVLEITVDTEALPSPRDAVVGFGVEVL